MRLPKFSYATVASPQEAVCLLARGDRHTLLAAGGTELLPRMKHGLAQPHKLVSLRRVAVKTPEMGSDGALRLDALTRLTTLSRAAVVREAAPALAAAARAVGSAEIRNMATLGGNLAQDSRCLYYNQAHDFQFTIPCFKRGGARCYFIPGGNRCHAVFMADTAPALICLGAEVEVIGLSGCRIMPLEKLYSQDPLQPLTLMPAEILSQVTIPARPPLRAEAFLKFSWRPGFEYGALSVAVALDFGQDRQTCVAVRIAAGSIAAAPVRARTAEALLTGRRPTPASVAAAAEAASVEIQPIPHHGYSRAYLRECLRVQVRRALQSALKPTVTAQ